MKLYKFRPLANDEDFDRAMQILEKGCFWCSKFSELNDPMEGIFTIKTTEDVDSIINSIYNKKNKYKICSFSDESAFENPLMWGYYANGFKGIAIELEVDEKKVSKVEYAKDAPCLNNLSTPRNIKKLLTTKLVSWQHEGEYRFLKEDNGNLQKIGKITAIYFGNPFGEARNKNRIYCSSPSLKKYKKLKEKLLKVAVDVKIKCDSVAIENNKVVKCIKAN